jgi:MoaA/NifB/PqqE/SkfB family radical SAM enzyme
LKNFKKLKGDCILGVSFIIDKDNAAHVYDQLKLFHEIGVNSVKVSACITSDDPVECNQYHAPFFEEVKKQIADAKEKFQSDTFEIQDSYYEMSHRFLKDYDWCPYLQVVPVIGADLNIYSCHDKAYTKMGILGSIKDQNFDDFWMNDKSKFFKIKPNVDCNHHCMVNYQNELLVEYLNINEVYKEFV